jgi:hypothetical protein
VEPVRDDPQPDLKVAEIGSDSDILSRVRQVCLSLPEAVEQEAWGEPTFRVRKKMFAMFASAKNHHGAGRDALWVNAPLGVQEHLVASDPTTYFVPPYAGVKGWIGLDLAKVGEDDLRAHVTGSYCMVAPKKLLSLLDA